MEKVQRSPFSSLPPISFQGHHGSNPPRRQKAKEPTDSLHLGQLPGQSREKDGEWSWRGKPKRSSLKNVLGKERTRGFLMWLEVKDNSCQPCRSNTIEGVETPGFLTLFGHVQAGDLSKSLYFAKPCFSSSAKEGNLISPAHLR